MPRKTVVVVAGPTASGKTALSISLAKYFGTEIISADSRQVYREMNIGTAKPHPAQLAEVPHHLIGHVSIHEPYSAGSFARDAHVALNNIFAGNDMAIVAGGTGLYIKAVLEGFDEFPDVPEDVRLQLMQDLEQNGLQALQEELGQKDPETYTSIATDNPRRVVRALEICRSTGKKYSSFIGKKKFTKNFEVVKIALDLTRQELYGRINKRCDEMLEQGLLNEVKQLFPYRHLNALQTVGYNEFFNYLSGTCRLAEATEKFKQHTRNYAKRQLTWFRKDTGYMWFSPGKEEDVKMYINNQQK